MKKQRIIYVILAFCAILFIVFMVRRENYGEQEANNELMRLDTFATMEDLEKLGYIDVTEPLTEKNETIEDFLENARNRRHAVLRVALVIDGELWVKILFYDKKLQLIQMWTADPNKQRMSDPGKRFNTDYEIEKNGNVVSVKLINVPNESDPIEGERITIDEVLYSYIDQEVIN